MTATTMDLRELLEKTANTDFLREMIGFTAQRRAHSALSVACRGRFCSTMPRH
jgi:hypothetical protein